MRVLFAVRQRIKWHLILVTITVCSDEFRCEATTKYRSGAQALGKPQNREIGITDARGGRV